MSFNLSRTQFLQMFAVMQSFRLINSYTAARVAPGVGWQNLNIETEQFTALIDLLFKTPLMPSLKSMPPESNDQPIFERWLSSTLWAWVLGDPGIICDGYRR